MSKSSRVLFGLLLPVSALVACATSPGNDDLEEGLEGDRNPAPLGSPPAPNADASLLAQIEFSAPGYNGTGCPQGTGAVALSADHQTLSVTAPAAFNATTVGSIVDRRKICQASVAFTPKAGIRLGIASIKLTGSATLAGSGAGRVTLEKRFPFGADDVTTISVASSGPLSLESDVGVTWSECGASSIAIASAALVASGTSADMKGAGFTATLVAERCQ